MSVRGPLGADLRRPVLVTASLVVLGMGTAACSGAQGADRSDASPAAESSSAESPEAPSKPPKTKPVRVNSNIASGATAVPVDTVLKLTADSGALDKVSVVGRGEEDVRLPGTLAADGSSWQATERLEPGSTYAVNMVTTNSDGDAVKKRRTFETAPLTLDQQTYPNISPLQDETVGVGMPIIIGFDVPVKDKASIERHLSVRASGPVDGAWRWYSDTEVHFRPRTYWRPGATVTVKADINGVDAGNGVYGQMDREVSFAVGKSVISKIDIKKHRMQVYVNGSLARTIAVTTGKKGFETRSGTKVIIEKFAKKRMDAATTGVSEDDPEYYDIEDVPYALRVTYSGEFVHGAPWSAGAQGNANVSHGCVGMSVSDARWLYGQTRRGDVVEVKGSKRHLEDGNGWTDWDLPFWEYRQGSALS
ncbi:MAG: L,D-transpeptidase family protein [Propionibacteriales bacterium]|nr:L,D-transpeptidase family protein [Propionibacteriales bacterium]